MLTHSPTRNVAFPIGGDDGEEPISVRVKLHVAQSQGFLRTDVVQRLSSNVLLVGRNFQILSLETEICCCALLYTADSGALLYSTRELLAASRQNRAVRVVGEDWVPEPRIHEPIDFEFVQSVPAMGLVAHVISSDARATGSGNHDPHPNGIIRETRQVDFGQIFQRLRRHVTVSYREIVGLDSEEIPIDGLETNPLTSFDRCNQGLTRAGNSLPIFIMRVRKFPTRVRKPVRGYLVTSVTAWLVSADSPAWHVTLSSSAHESEAPVGVPLEFHSARDHHLANVVNVLRNHVARIVLNREGLGRKREDFVVQAADRAPVPDLSPQILQASGQRFSALVVRIDRGGSAGFHEPLDPRAELAIRAKRVRAHVAA